jgi:uncharacterized DUF497 family protein
MSGGLHFEWDPEKALSNFRKHDLSFEEAATAFGDLASISIVDPDHSETEQRWILLGMSTQGKLLVVVHTERRDNIRIISARRATRRERRTYESKRN